MNTEWVIQSLSEGEDGEPAYWSNRWGWMLGVESATSFDGSQGFPGYSHRLPMSRDMDAAWIPLRDAESDWAGDVIVSLSPEETRKVSLIEVKSMADRGQISVDLVRPQWFEVLANLVNGRVRTVAIVREASTASSVAQRLSAETRAPIHEQHAAMAA
jgi:hypothetical protein